SARSYGTSDGMNSRECNGGFQPAGWKTRDGRLWFPTEKGLVVVDPQKLKANSLPPPVQIEQAFVDRKPFNPGDQVRAGQGKGHLEFNCTAMSCIAPERIRFRYQLGGFDEDWVGVGNRREAYYTNIRPGKYKFRVIAANADDVWNEEGTS